MRYLLCLAVALAGASRLLADEHADARTALEKAGIRASSTGVVLAKEAELTKELGKSAGLKRNVLQTEKDLKAAELQVDGVQRTLTQLRQQHMQLSAQLANINVNDIALNNKLVGALKVIEGQFDTLKEQKGRVDEQVKSSRAKANEAREAYVELALSTRRLADEIEAECNTKAADPE